MEAHTLPALALELRAELGMLAEADYAGHALLQMKKQVRLGPGQLQHALRSVNPAHVVSKSFAQQSANVLKGPCRQCLLPACSTTFAAL